MQAQRERLRAANEELELNNEQQRSQLHAIQVAIILLCKYFFTNNVDLQTTERSLIVFNARIKERMLNNMVYFFCILDVMAILELSNKFKCD